MATNTNMMQINTFAKGMDTDTSDMLISNESYRLAENLRFITDVDETSGELRLIEGAKQLSINYGEDFNKTFTILAFNSIRNIGALVCRDDDDNWAVFRIEYNEYPHDELIPTRVFGWCETPIGSDTKISTTMKWEDSDQLQLYIADGEHPIMKINLFDEQHSTDISYIQSHSNVQLSQPAITDVLSGGALKSGLVQYAYQLYNENNVGTNISPLSSVKSIVGPYTEIGPIGLQVDEHSSMGLRIKMSIDSSIYSIYNYIKIFRIHYQINGQQPLISVICDKRYSTSNNLFSFDDLGLASLQELTTEEFNSIAGITIIPKVIEQKNNILFAGNVKYDIDELDDEYLNMDFRAFSSGDGVTDQDVQDENWPTENVVNSNLDMSENYDADAWLIPGVSSAGVYIGGTGANIRWLLKFDEGVDVVLNTFPNSEYPTQDELKIRNSEYAYQNPDRKYLAHDEIYRYGIILYSKSGTKYPTKWICDIRTPNIGNLDSRLTNFTNIINIDNQNRCITGNGIFVQFELRKSSYNPSTDPLSEKNPLDTDKISGYEIVRVKRTIQDSATITQGIVAATLKPTKEDPSDVDLTNSRCSTGMPFLDHVDYKTILNESSAVERYARSDINVMQFYSPESSYNIEETLQLIRSNNNIYLQALQLAKPTILGQITVTSNISIDNKSYVCSTNGYRNNKLSYTPCVRIESGNDEIDKTFFSSNSGTGLDVVEVEFTRSSSPESGTFDSLYGYNMYKMMLTDLATSIQHSDGGQTSTYDPKYTLQILDCDKVQPIQWDEYITEKQFNGRDYQSIVGDKTFYNCVAPFIIADRDGEFTVDKMKKTATANRFKNELVATCDPSLVLNVDDSYDDWDNIFHFYYSKKLDNRGDSYTDHERSILCNIRKSNVIPYGGFDESSRNNSTYIQSGYYYNSTDVAAKNIFDGDVKPVVFEFATAHKWHSGTQSSPQVCILCQVPVESRIDVSLDSGDRFSNNKASNASLVQVNPCNFDEQYIQKKPSYVYNTAYSVQPQVIVNSGIDIYRETIKSFDNRIHYSNQAEALQSIDPWLVFQPLNYLDVDSQYGPITNLRTFKNQLIFWQEKAAGVLSVNERVQIADQSNLPLILGTGGVLDRYDYLTTTNGMKENQHADAQSEQALYWWDFDNHSICSYSGGGVVQLSKIKKIQNLLTSWNKGKDGSSLIDSDITIGKWPLLLYDNKYNEVLFKVGNDGEKDVTIAYSEQLAQFMSIYHIDPSAYFNFGAQLVLFDQSQNKQIPYRWNQFIYSQQEEPISKGFYTNDLLPYLKYVINEDKTNVKVYDNVEFAGTIPNSDTAQQPGDTAASTLDSSIRFDFKTPLKQTSYILGTNITNRQLDFKFAIPRKNQSQWGDRLRGKTMQCEMSSTSNSLNFSLQYFITKYRISWS